MLPFYIFAYQKNKVSMWDLAVENLESSNEDNILLCIFFVLFDVLCDLQGRMAMTN